MLEEPGERYVGGAGRRYVGGAGRRYVGGVWGDMSEEFGRYVGEAGDMVGDGERIG